MRHALIVATVFLLVGCSTLQVTEVNPKTGYLPAMTGAKPTIVTSKPFALDTHKGLALATGSDFLKGQLEKLNFFEQVIERKDLETLIVKGQLTDQVPSVQDRIGLNRAARFYRSFMWIHFETREEGRSKYVQLVLTDAVTLDDVFVAERVLDFVWAGVNDQNTFYPLFNALIDYMKANSTTYSQSSTGS